MRFELLEALTRVSILKFGKDLGIFDISDSVNGLLHTDLVPGLAKNPQLKALAIDRNVFKRRLYTKVGPYLHLRAPSPIYSLRFRSASLAVSGAPHAESSRQVGGIREQACAEVLEGMESVLKAMYCFFKGKERKRTMQMPGWIRCCELLGWTGRDRDGGLSYQQVLCACAEGVPSCLLA
jgi:hypothetical protein